MNVENAVASDIKEKNNMLSRDKISRTWNQFGNNWERNTDNDYRKLIVIFQGSLGHEIIQFRRFHISFP